jgi:hypothetical protein
VKQASWVTHPLANHISPTSSVAIELEREARDHEAFVVVIKGVPGKWRVCAAGL